MLWLKLMEVHVSATTGASSMLTSTLRGPLFEEMKHWPE